MAEITDNKDRYGGAQPVFSSPACRGRFDAFQPDRVRPRTHESLGSKTKSAHGAPLRGGVSPHRSGVRRLLRCGHDGYHAPAVETPGMAGLRYRIRGSHANTFAG